MIRLELESAAGARRVDLASYLDAAREERAHEDEYAWIKALRGMRVDDVPFRDRFTLRGDSLWWFAELYLHKQRTILNVFRTLAAFDALVERERPSAIRYGEGPLSGVIAQAAALAGLSYDGPGWPAHPKRALLAMEARSRGLATAARLSRLRSPAMPAAVAAPRVAAFVHRAFWRGDTHDGGAEAYIGPVLRAIESALAPDEVRYVGVGPRSNFRARRWWDPLFPPARESATIIPIERYAPVSTLADSRGVQRTRHQTRRSLCASADLRDHAVIRGCDCWPLVRQELAGIALLQLPWSARAMDEAGAALDALRPAVAVTYAEAGGWGRAVALECRRRGIPLAGLQHGFIYRHWLNYRHEPDEMAPSAGNPADAGFPYPASTLLFDEQAERQLIGAGRFPSTAVEITGSARLDELIAAVRAAGSAEIEALRHEMGATGGRHLVLLATKEREARRFLPELIAAAAAMPDVQLVIKPHPAETADVYTAAAGGKPNVRVAEADASLPLFLAAARAVVTVNSTVAIDAMALGVPSLVIGLPNNLSPFVDRGDMLGGGSAGEIRAALGKLLYDQEFRDRFERRAERGAAARSARAVLALSAANAKGTL